MSDFRDFGDFKRRGPSFGGSLVSVSRNSGSAPLYASRELDRLNSIQFFGMLLRPGIQELGLKSSKRVIELSTSRNKVPEVPKVSLALFRKASRRPKEFEASGLVYHRSGIEPKT